MNATNLKQINILNIFVGDIVRFHGARFEITTTRIYKETDERLIENGCFNVMCANGKWIDGQIVDGYFGPTKDWGFQGNKNATVMIEM